MCQGKILPTVSINYHFPPLVFTADLLSLLEVKYGLGFFSPFLVRPRGLPLPPLPQMTTKIKKYIAMPFICNLGDCFMLKNRRVIVD